MPFLTTLFDCMKTKAEELEPIAIQLESALKLKIMTVVEGSVTEVQLNQAIKLGLERFLPAIKGHPVLEGDVLMAVDGIADAYLFHDKPSINQIIDRIASDTVPAAAAKLESIAMDVMEKKGLAISQAAPKLAPAAGSNS